MIDIVAQLNPYTFMIVDHIEKLLYNLASADFQDRILRGEEIDDERLANGWYVERDERNLVTIFSWEP